MKRVYVVFCIAVFFLSYCSTFVDKEFKPEIKKLENDSYIVKKHVSIGGLRLSKNQKIKIIVVGGDEWVKVYGYGYDENVLKAKRVLILYLFESDFKDDIFNLVTFKEKLFQIISKEDEIKKSGKKNKKRRKRRKR
ncbi:hypothetical protein ACFL20_00320 [Spirochaetota bacterium]